MRRAWWRWWFEDRSSGRIVIGQRPNGFALAATAASAGERATRGIAPLAPATRWAATALWGWWGVGELLQGVNPWRRLLGAIAIGWQLGRVAQFTARR